MNIMRKGKGKQVMHSVKSSVEEDGFWPLSDVLS